MNTRSTMITSSMKILLALGATTAVAHADPSTKVLGGIAAAKQNAEHLERVLARRNMPGSVVKTPDKVVRATERDLRPRLLEGITAEPNLQQNGRALSLEVNGNRTSHIESTVRVSSNVGTQEQRVANQFIQETNETVQQSARRDPRIGIQVTGTSVTQWKTHGTPVNRQLVQGPGKVRTITPLSPGLKFRGEHLDPGSSLVTVNSGQGTQIYFNADDSYNTVRNASASTTYLLKAHADGRLKAVRLTAQEQTDLRANTPFASYKLNQNGTEMEQNHAKGYSPEALKEGGF